MIYRRNADELNIPNKKVFYFNLEIHLSNSLVLYSKTVIAMKRGNSIILIKIKFFLSNSIILCPRLLRTMVSYSKYIIIEPYHYLLFHTLCYVKYMYKI